jgi:5-oxoprolinase (ATP-hydrolysing)
VRGLGKTFGSLGKSVFARLEELRTTSSAPPSTSLKEVDPSAASLSHSVYFESVGRVQTPIFKLENLSEGDVVKGPAMIIDVTQTIVLDPSAEGVVAGMHLVIELH